VRPCSGSATRDPRDLSGGDRRPQGERDVVGHGGVAGLVDFYYSVRHADDAVYRDEIELATRRHPSVHAHFVSTDTDPMLTADGVLRSIPPGASPWIYMCGPPQMMRALAHGFRRPGVPPGHVRWEQFGGR